MSTSTESPLALAELVRAGDRGAVARALNLVDDGRAARRAEALDLLDALEGKSKGRRIGITGAPGAGKSTLLDALATRLGSRGRSVAILAIDPSSRKSGGALLGDRFRMGASARDSGVFFRSLAARDQLGGLSEVTGASLDVLAAAFDTVFVETVGVGQSEAGIVDLVEHPRLRGPARCGRSRAVHEGGHPRVARRLLRQQIGSLGARRTHGQRAARGDRARAPG